MCYSCVSSSSSNYVDKCILSGFNQLISAIAMRLNHRKLLRLCAFFSFVRSLRLFSVNKAPRACNQCTNETRTIHSFDGFEASKMNNNVEKKTRGRKQEARKKKIQRKRLPLESVQQVMQFAWSFWLLLFEHEQNPYARMLEFHQQIEFFSKYIFFRWWFDRKKNWNQNDIDNAQNRNGVTQIKIRSK